MKTADSRRSPGTRRPRREESDVHAKITHTVRIISQLWLNGIIFIMFVSGYLFYTILKVVRLMQKRGRLTIIAAALVVIAGAVTGVTCYHFLPFGKDRRPVELIIAPKMSLREVADTLESLNIIRSSSVLRAWMRIRKTEGMMQAGLVIVHRGDGALRTARGLLQAKPLETSLMVPEGLTIEQTAFHLSRIISLDTSRFIALCYDSAFMAECGITAPSLEGYLFPDTYRFPEQVSDSSIIRRMTASYLDIWKAIDIDSGIAKTYSPFQLLTLASIIEREATLLSEQPRISGVFHNRLRLGYPLGADPTVRFALKKFNGPLRVSELNCPSPYNTRKFTGLPPGPICSPGRSALSAAARPMVTRDLYFVAKWDGSGAHDFSETNAEHDRKKNEIRLRNMRRLRQKASRAE